MHVERFSLLYYVFCSQRWSFGIVLWEIFTLGQEEPYSHMSNKEFLDYMIKNNGEIDPRLPENGSDEM